jgi:serine/threonine-protein kinase
VERAQRELRQLQRANNPHIVKVVDFGKTAEGRLFVASELASGEPLDQVVERVGPMTMDRAKRIAAQVGEALLEAQKVGVVHRDLAAKNVLVSADDEVRLINFAIPRPLFDNLFGVPQFMSPEQSEGKLIDQRSNTYSLGSLFYLMLTGHPPHTGETPRAVVAAIQKGELVPPSIKRGEGLTAEVDRIVLKALERNSSRRPLTMRQFLTDLSGLIVTDEQANATVAAPATGGGSGRDAGFARTMMFAGGATEVQKLVAQAVAARQVAGNGAGEPLPASAKIARSVTPPPLGEDNSLSATPAAAPAAPVPVPAEVPSAATPSPVSRPAHGAAVAATMVAMPASTGTVPSPLPPEGGGIETSGQPLASAKIPAAATSSPAAGAGGTPAPEAGPNFRETLWFKKGDVDQMVADARAKMAAIADAKKASSDAEGPAEEARPLEDRYVDDGTVTVEDREKFSLGSGGTSASMRARAASVPGERMSEDEILDEIGGGKRVVIIAIVGAVVVALIAVIAVSMKSGGKDKRAEGAATPPAATSAAPENPPTPLPSTAAPENAANVAPPAPPDRAAPTSGGQAEPDDGGGAATKPSPPKKRTTTKKKASTVVKKRK